jgi:hypothetical protein
VGEAEAGASAAFAMPVTTGPTRMTAADVMKKKRAAQALNVGSS